MAELSMEVELWHWRLDGVGCDNDAMKSWMRTPRKKQSRTEGNRQVR